MKNICQTMCTVVAIGTALSSTLMVEAPKAQAASIAINNANFSNPVLAPGQHTDQLNSTGIVSNPPVPGWTIYDPSGVIASANTTTNSDLVGVGNPLPAALNVPPPGNVALFYLPDVNKGVVGLSQTLTSSLQANTNYTLKAVFDNLKPFTLSNGFTVPYGGFPGYRLELLAGGNVIAADNNSVSVPDGALGTSVVSYSALANDPNLGKPLQVRFIDLNSAPGLEVDFTNVSLTATAIPESTSTLGLLAFGAVSALRRKLAD